jgi:hypothetical protein
MRRATPFIWEVNVNNVQFGNIIFGDSGRIVAAITTGAGWEIWMQVELTILLRANNIQAAREVPYPPPNGNLTLDVIAQDNAGIYAIELKVESATNAGAAIINAINQDRQKITLYPQPNPGARWVVGIGYSNAALVAMQNFATNATNNAIFGIQGGIGVLIATV